MSWDLVWQVVVLAVVFTIVFVLVWVTVRPSDPAARERRLRRKAERESKGEGQ